MKNRDYLTYCQALFGIMGNVKFMGHREKRYANIKHQWGSPIIHI